MVHRRFETIMSPGDPRLADYRDLTDAQARRSIEGDGLFIGEGVLVLRQLVEHRHRLRSVLVTPSRAASLSDLLLQLDSGVPILVADPGVIEQVAGFHVHRGVLASVWRPERADPADLLARARRVVVTEQVNDNENIGAIFRNAAGLGCDAVLLDERSADPLYRRSVRVSLGWSMILPHARVPDVAGTLPLLRGAGLRVVALATDPGSIAVDRAAAAGLLDEPLALVVGAEGSGLSRAALDGADAIVSIPMTDRVDSLNVATALAVVAAFAAARRGWST